MSEENLNLRGPDWVERLRASIPVLQRQIDERPIVYLDNASTTLKPIPVLHAMQRYDCAVSANIHRGKHALSEEASDLYESARSMLARFVGATPRDVVFTSNATMAIQLVALGFPFAAGDNVVVTGQEHHSNILPWRARATLRHVDVAADGRIPTDALCDLIDARTRVVALSLASNVTGRVHDLAEIIDRAHQMGALVCVDAAQAAPHHLVDMRALKADFVAFSGHKMLGPTGIGVLVGSRAAFDRIASPFVGGGTPKRVTWAEVTEKPAPFRFEAGTPPIAQAIGLARAAELLMEIGRERAQAHEARLASKMVEVFATLPKVRLLGPSPEDSRLALASLVPMSDAISADHLAMMLSDRDNIMARSGTHCCHPFFDSIDCAGALRMSAYLYNTVEDIEVAADALRRGLQALSR